MRQTNRGLSDYRPDWRRKVWGLQLLFKYQHKFTNPEVLNVGNQLIGIIKYLHAKGIVHRDIRIPNVLISRDTISLVDFGLARWMDNKRYTRDIDFSYLGDFLLYLLYSTYQKVKPHSRPWYEELQLTSEQKLFLKKLLKIEAAYSDVDQIARDFQKVFPGDKKEGW